MFITGIVTQSVFFVQEGGVGFRLPVAGFWLPVF
jgi:hypothetical protein